MTYTVRNTALGIPLAISVLALSNTVVAGGTPEKAVEPEGVLLDISLVDPKNDYKKGADTPSAISSPLLEAVKSKGGEVAAVEPVVVQIVAAKSVAAEAETDASGVVRTTATAPTPIKSAESVVSTKEGAKKAVSDAAANKDTQVLTTIVEAMRPKDRVPPLNNDRLSVYLSDYVAFAQFEKTATRFNLDRGRTHLAFLYSEERDTVAQGGLSLDASFTSSFRLSFGARAYIALLNLENMDAFAGALGAETAYKLPFTALPLEFGASVYYAPDILTFGAGDRVIDWQVDVTLPVRSQLSIFGGVRFLQVDTRPADREIDNRVHLGVRWDFL